MDDDVFSNRFMLSILEYTLPYCEAVELVMVVFNPAHPIASKQPTSTDKAPQMREQHTGISIWVEMLSNFHLISPAHPPRKPAEQSTSSCSDSTTNGFPWRNHAPSIAPVALNAQHPPQSFWSLTAVTAPLQTQRYCLPLSSRTL